MESDDGSNSQAGPELQFDMGNKVELGLEKDSLQHSLKPRNKKMESGGGSKKRVKVTPVEVGFDSDDDEPIGSLLKLRKPKNPKKIKAALEGSVEKCHKVEVKAHKILGEDEEDLGEMNDTLASFRKKLKCPKKDIEPGTMRGRGYALNESVEDDGVLDGKSVSKTVEKGQDIGEDRSNVITDKGVERKSTGKVRRGKFDSKAKAIGDDDDSEGLESQVEEDQNEGGLWPGEVSDQPLDEKLEESLSTFFQRAQSGLQRKSRPNLSLKQNCKATHHAFVSKNPSRNCDGSSLSVSGISLLHSTSKECNTAVNQRFDDGVCQQETILEPCDFNVQKGPIEDPCRSPKVCEKDGNRHSNIQRRDNCSAVDQRGKPESEGLKDGLELQSTAKTGSLVPCVVEMANSLSSSNLMEEIHGSGAGGLVPQSMGISNEYILSADPEIYSVGKENSNDELLNKSYENACEETAKLESGFVFNQYQEGSQQIQLNLSLSAVDSLKMEETCSDGPNTCAEEKSLETHVHPNELVASIRRCNSALHQPSEDASHGACVPSHDCFSINEVADGDSPTSLTPDENESCHEDAVSLPSSEIKDSKLSSIQRAGRNIKKRRHGDMAYEGDADWENLINEQGFFGSQQFVDSDRSFRAREKFDEAAVSAGLKARAVGPVEKIKFKEVLKRRGGLQEYLECRNHILGLWSKDVTRILPLVDCGVTDTPSEGEPARASLIREIYAFLDQSGYINFGIASKKEKAELNAKHNYQLLEEENFEGSSGASIADSEDGVAFILGQVKTPEAPVEAKNGVRVDDQNLASEAKLCEVLVDSITPELPNVKVQEECLSDNCQQNDSIDAKLNPGLINLQVPSADLSCNAVDMGIAPVVTLEERNDSQYVQSAADDNPHWNDHLKGDSEVRKKIIVVGAGPAGLTAARHLQRQGFSVVVLEARNRIGGRVHTDCSSLSVPVDLGASIITGVEADVSTNRRPDPSSLVCAQLGLELTVLNSSCPLYDIVTGQKVPADLDDALEAEYNTLLDDMVFLVAQKGEKAMRMSLEDGLEYALKRHRMAEIGADIEETESHSSVEAFYDAKASNVIGNFPEEQCSKEEILSSLERRVMNWHYAHLEYGCAASLKEVSLPHWNQDDVYGGFGGPHCMIKGGYSTVVESLAEGLLVHLNHVVTNISYSPKDSGIDDSQHRQVKVSTLNGGEFSGDAVLITVPLGCLKAGAIEFSPPLPQWKHSSIQRLGFGVLNKVVLEFPEVFWDDTVDYFGVTAEETDSRGHCFMFWNVRKTVGAPVLIALVAGKAAIDGQSMSSSDHVNHAVIVLRKLFGEASVPDPVASVVTDWGRDPFSYGAYSYVAIGASGEDYDMLGRPVENCLFFAGEATCKEHPDTVGGAMLSGLREAVRLIDIFTTGNDYTAEVEAMEAAQRQSESEKDEVRDVIKRLEAVELSNVLYKNSLDRARLLTREALLQDMFFNVKTTAGRLHLAKKLLGLPVESLKSFAGTKEGLTTLNSWMLDSMGKDGTQLLRHCVRLLVLVSTDLVAVRSSGIGKTVKEKVCVHTSRDIRAIASQLVNVWLEVFRKAKASSKRKFLKDAASGKPPLRSHHGAFENKRSLQDPSSAGSQYPVNVKENGKSMGVEAVNLAMSEEEQAAFAAEAAARAAAKAAAEALASTEANCNKLLQLPKIPSFHKFARREQYAQMDERKWPGGVLGRQDCISEIDSRNCRVRDWSVDFSAACVNLDSSRMSVDNLSQRSHSNEIASHLKLREHSGESLAVDSSIFTKAWVDTAGSGGIKDYHAIERWQSQAAAADLDFFHPTMHVKDEEDSYASSRQPTWKHDGRANESSISQITVNKERFKNHPRGADRIKQAVVDYVASLLMPLYKARKIDKEGYKSIMKKTATKVMEIASDAEKNMAISEFLDFKRKNKIRSFVDKLIERHMAMKPVMKP
ncbi:lysine-specific histone demethylase 1 homolog 3 isoform X1 [Herrania umbratica]|uniref:Lysine-specific histone demethylase 1 homolog 3 isoform X1 n=1 Tax=Herrania umbratica TaxID=108875 RepID=A0A6J1ABC2_9ROSI|nr:lysine-specific histone demethylase 1 homolog 3 isoform X1 [Herrania umbratica]